MGDVIGAGRFEERRAQVAGVQAAEAELSREQAKSADAAGAWHFTGIERGASALATLSNVLEAINTRGFPIQVEEEEMQYLRGLVDDASAFSIAPDLYIKEKAVFERLQSELNLAISKLQQRGEGSAAWQVLQMFQGLQDDLEEGAPKLRVVN